MVFVISFIFYKGSKNDQYYIQTRLGYLKSSEKILLSVHMSFSP